MTMFKSQSPAPKKSNLKTLNFFEALKEIHQGNKVTRIEWADKGIYGFMNAEILSLHKADGNHQWIVSLGDMAGADWILI